MDAIESLAALRIWRLIGTVLSALALAAGCGGGGSSGGVGIGGTGAPQSFASGRISGFGSIIVNGVRFDDAGAAVTDDDAVSHDRAELKLGMTVDIAGGAVTDDASTGTRTARAATIEFHSEIKGPVESVNVAGNTLTVLGQKIDVDAATVFDDFIGGLASVQVGNLVEVFAFFDAATTSYRATRIESKSALAQFKLRGVVASLDTTAKTFMIGSAKISYAGIAAADMPVLSNGLVVRVTLQTAQQALTWIATKISAGARHLPDNVQTEVEGIVSDFVSLSSFKVNGVSVDASGSAVVFENGTAGNVANGVRVEVQGATLNGVLVTSKLEFKRADDEDVEIELHGAIDSVAAADHTFVLRGQTVRFDSSTRIDDGTLAGLVVGARVEVRGALSATGNQVIATRIKFEH